jgi:hypothetical protein
MTSYPSTKAHIDPARITSGMPITCSQNGVVGVVDGMEGSESIRVNKDRDGLHHYIPIGWVARLDKKVHLDRPAEQVKREWSDTVPLGRSST